MKERYLSDLLYSEQMFGCAVSLLHKLNSTNINANAVMDTKRLIIGILRSAIRNGQAERTELFWQLALKIQQFNLYDKYTMNDFGDRTLSQVLMEYAFLKADPLDQVFLQRLQYFLPNFLPSKPSAIMAQQYYQAAMALPVSTELLQASRALSFSDHWDNVLTFRAWAQARRLNTTRFLRHDLIGKRNIMFSLSFNETDILQQHPQIQNIADSNARFTAIMNVIIADPLPYFHSIDQAVLDIAAEARKLHPNVTKLRTYFESITHQPLTGASDNEVIEAMRLLFAEVYPLEFLQQRIDNRTMTMDRLKLLWQAIHADPCNVTYHEEFAWMQQQMNNTMSASLAKHRISHLYNIGRHNCSLTDFYLWNQTDYLQLQHNFSESQQINVTEICNLMSHSWSGYCSSDSFLVDDSLVIGYKSAMAHCPKVPYSNPTLSPNIGWHTVGFSALTGFVGGSVGYLGCYAIDRSLRRLRIFTDPHSQQLSVMTNVSLFAIYQMIFRPPIFFTACPLFCGFFLDLTLEQFQFSKPLSKAYSATVHLLSTLLTTYYFLESANTVPTRILSLFASFTSAGIASWGLQRIIPIQPASFKDQPRAFVNSDFLARLNGLDEQIHNDRDENTLNLNAIDEDNDSTSAIAIFLRKGNVDPSGLFAFVPNETLANIVFYLSYRDFLHLSQCSATLRTRLFDLMHHNKSFEYYGITWINQLKQQLANDQIPINQFLRGHTHQLYQFHDTTQPLHRRILKRRLRLEQPFQEFSAYPFSYLSRFSGVTLIFLISSIIVTKEIITSESSINPNSLDWLSNPLLISLVVVLSCLGYEFGDALLYLIRSTRQATQYQEISEECGLDEIDDIDELDAATSLSLQTIKHGNQIASLFNDPRPFASELVEGSIRGFNDVLAVKADQENFSTDEDSYQLLGNI